MRRVFIVVALALLAGSCGGPDVDVSAVPELPEATRETIIGLLAASEQPVVLNVWASWCIPCRSEAPLLERAAREFEGRVSFIGLNFNNDQAGARRFIAEFFPDAPIVHYIDADDDIPPALGGTFGVPQTFFFAAGGELIDHVPAVIDERTLALQIDEILARSG